MELREYWGILWQRRWIILAVVILAVLSNVAFTWRVAPPPFRATIRLAVKPQIEPRSDKFYTFDEYYAYVASEYLVDDVIEVVQSPAFHSDLRAKLAGKLAGGLGTLEAKKAHRVMSISITSPSHNDALLEAAAVGELLSEKGSKYFSSISSQNPEVKIVDPPSAYQLGENRRSLDLVLRAVLGLLAGIGLAVLLEYLSDTVKGAAYVEGTLGLPVLAEIPQESKRLRRRGSEPALKTRPTGAT
ncbi:MAG: Wzz/FepE/Etk N-terminal domain-containing protein [Chloroflexi bacterium]|nr:Wzz/FepE/Etk N-terminal domain-containing protein [Chloroflexota bacterium]